jgi:hypothetical protein
MSDGAGRGLWRRWSARVPPLSWERRGERRGKPYLADAPRDLRTTTNGSEVPTDPVPAEPAAARVDGADELQPLLLHDHVRGQRRRPLLLGLVPGRSGESSAWPVKRRKKERAFVRKDE